MLTQRPSQWCAASRTFPIVAAGIVDLLDDQEPVHPGVEAPPQIGPGDIVAVVPARAAGVCREGVAPDRPGLDHRRSLLHRAVGFRGHVEPVPVHDIVDVGVVADIDAHLVALAQPQRRARHLAVIGERVDHLARRELEPLRRDPQRMVRRACDLRIAGSQSRPERHPGCARSKQKALELAPFTPVTRGLDPRVHLLRKKRFAKFDGLPGQARQ